MTTYDAANYGDIGRSALIFLLIAIVLLIGAIIIVAILRKKADKPTERNEEQKEGPHDL